MCCFYSFSQEQPTRYWPGILPDQLNTWKQSGNNKDGNQRSKREANRRNLLPDFFVTVKVVRMKSRYKPGFDWYQHRKISSGMMKPAPELHFKIICSWSPTMARVIFSLLKRMQNNKELFCKCPRKYQNTHFQVENDDNILPRRWPL